MGNLNLTPVVRDLLIINILVYVGTMMLPSEEQQAAITQQLAVFYPESPFFKPWQIITHMFMHGSINHIFFNMFGLVSIGPSVEAMFGPKKFLFYYLFCGVGAVLLQFAVQYYEFHYGSNPAVALIPMVGASGAIFGLLAAYGMLFPNNQLMLMFIPYPIRAKYFVLLYAAFELFSGIGGFQVGVAHFAHVGGALFGFLLILYWRNGRL